MLSGERFKSAFVRLIRRVNKQEWFHYISILRYERLKRKYEYVSHPYKIIRVDPSNIGHRVLKISVEDGLGHILGGDWKTEPIDQISTYTGLKQRFERGYDWKNTDYVKYAETKFEQGKNRFGYDNIDQFIDERCTYVDGLFKKIKEDGYQTSYRINTNFPDGDIRNKSYYQDLDPLIAIGENGEIYWRDGFHRFTIAEILGIDIPALVVARHKKWQGVRDTIGKNPEKHGFCEHPDVQDIITGKETIVSV